MCGYLTLTKDQAKAVRDLFNTSRKLLRQHLFDELELFANLGEVRVKLGGERSDFTICVNRADAVEWYSSLDEFEELYEI